MPGIHVFNRKNSWMAGASPAMTNSRNCGEHY
jgi:hypothetical protein